MAASGLWPLLVLPIRVEPYRMAIPVVDQRGMRLDKDQQSLNPWSSGDVKVKEATGWIWSICQPLTVWFDQLIPGSHRDSRWDLRASSV